MANVIQQGATPTHKFHTPYPKDFVESAIITYEQNDKIVLEKTGDELIVEDNSISAELTQEDTLSFSDDCDVKIQLKVKSQNGSVIPSKIIYATVDEVLNKEVM